MKRTNAQTEGLLLKALLALSMTAVPSVGMLVLKPTQRKTHCLKQLLQLKTLPCNACRPTREPLRAL